MMIKKVSLLCLVGLVVGCSGTITVKGETDSGAVEESPPPPAPASPSKPPQAPLVR